MPVPFCSIERGASGLLTMCARVNLKRSVCPAQEWSASHGTIRIQTIELPCLRFGTGSTGKISGSIFYIEIKNRRQPDAEANNDRPPRDISGTCKTSTLAFAVRFQLLL
jgi:hypothetical protein